GGASRARARRGSVAHRGDGETLRGTRLEDARGEPAAGDGTAGRGRPPESAWHGARPLDRTWRSRDRAAAWSTKRNEADDGWRRPPPSLRHCRRRAAASPVVARCGQGRIDGRGDRAADLLAVAAAITADRDDDSGGTRTGRAAPGDAIRRR